MSWSRRLGGTLVEPVAADRRRGSEVTGLVAFAGLLRVLGIEVPTPRIELATRALETIDADDREAAYWALRTTLTSSLEDIAPFDAAFAVFWEGAAFEGRAVPPPSAGDESADSTPSGSATEAETAGGEADPPTDQGPTDAGRRWSAAEQLRELDFRAYGEEELSRAAALISELARALPRRSSRRLKPAPAGRRLDRRATLRRAMRTEGHPIELAWRQPSSRPRRIVFAVDVSGSMEPYARPLMMFLQAARQASRNVEAFAFGTRLTRLTEELGGSYPDAALERVARAVPDWAGGTRIGDNLRRLNETWGRRGTTRGAVVVIFSDGWERGDVGLLRREMERLRRRSHSLIWVNPLAGDPRYEPLAAGMAEAMPFVDRFLAGHNLRGLEELVVTLSEMSERGAMRRPATAGGVGPEGKPSREGVEPASRL